MKSREIRKWMMFCLFEDKRRKCSFMFCLRVSETVETPAKKKKSIDSKQRVEALTSSIRNHVGTNFIVMTPTSTTASETLRTLNTTQSNSSTTTYSDPDSNQIHNPIPHLTPQHCIRTSQKLNIAI